MTGETHFERYLPEPHSEELVAPQEIRRHILCTGSGKGYLTIPSCINVCSRTGIFYVVARAGETGYQGHRHKPHRANLALPIRHCMSLVSLK